MSPLVCMQQPANATDVGSLLNLLSYTPPACNLEGRTITCPCESSAGSAAWRSVPIWPHQSETTADNAPRGLHTLTCPPQEAVLSTLTGAGTVVQHGSLQMAGAALILDTSCNGTQFKNIVIEGALRIDSRVPIKMPRVRVIYDTTYVT
jgi:hypothetical protein